MTTRTLPRAEWHRLEETETAEVLCRVPEAADPEVVVLEDGDRIVSSWAVMTFQAAHGAWIDPDYRGRADVREQMLEAMGAVVRRRGASSVTTGAMDRRMARFLRRLGASEVPGQVFTLLFRR